MRITQKDIARDLGIAFATVNRAFNNTGSVSEKLKRRIFDYAKKKGYAPHRASQVLVRNKIRIIAVFTPDFPQYFWDDIEKGVVNAAEQVKSFDYEAHFYRIEDKNCNNFIQILKREIKNGLQAAAFVGAWWSYDMDAAVAIVEKADIPYIMLNIDMSDSNRICYTGSDYRAGGRLVAQFIGKSLSIKRGGKALVLSIPDGKRLLPGGFNIHYNRIEGFRDVIHEQFPGIECQIEVFDTGEEIPGILKKYEHKVDAVYLISAFNKPFLKALEQFDYSRAITVMHDIDESSHHYLENNLLTAVVYQDPVQQGYTAIRTMEHILETGIRNRQKDIEIIHTLVFKENINFMLKYYMLAELEGLNAPAFEPSR
jgi:LacI family transcriptional regulator